MPVERNAKALQYIKPELEIIIKKLNHLRGLWSNAFKLLTNSVTIPGYGSYPCK
ncbi:hypothetical protein MuYL_1601 [Mucilaginibacter xinganensis]|uniref:Uncharacterized protein n=1 Tax=Mucilaginibacter xinganensis TaxID=1234841 RepID=A0A223NUC2_9SPHI|nr:hypothetical protein MuYL_1601 [Mucilaginibacter xinganensis]